MGPTKQVAVGLIETEIETQARVGLSDATIDAYAAEIRDSQDKGEQPFADSPIDLFFDGSRYYVGDGWHRIFSWQKTTIPTIPAIVHSGGQRDALLFATGANARHGLNRSDDDKRRAVEILLADAEWSQWSDRKIADHCKVSGPFVGKVRRKCEEEGADPATANGLQLAEGTAEPAKRLGRDGKRRPAPKGKPAEDAPAEPAAEEPETPGPNLKKLAVPYRDWMAALGTLKRELKAHAETPEGAHLATKVTRIVHDLDEARGAIRQAEPTAICGKCEGEGCQHCARTGFWTRFVVEQQKRD